jgi:hypothetical protein
MALNPFSENKIEKASSYQMGRDNIPIKRMMNAKTSIKMNLVLGLPKYRSMAKFYPLCQGHETLGPNLNQKSATVL